MTKRAGTPKPTTEEEIHQALMVIDSRIVTLDGKVTLVARANRHLLVPELEKVIKAKPMMGHIYLLLDGIKNQEALVAALKKKGIPTSKQAVSRWMQKCSEHGIADEVPGRGRGKTYRKNSDMEEAFNLSKEIEKWLAEVEKAGQPKKGKKR
jgi:DNA-binding transcriptional ArsR family regulator